jgi:hypothetical protein
MNEVEAATLDALFWVKGLLEQEGQDVEARVDHAIRVVLQSSVARFDRLVTLPPRPDPPPPTSVQPVV